MVDRTDREAFISRVSLTTGIATSGTATVDIPASFARVFDDFFDALATRGAVDFDYILHGNEDILNHQCVRRRRMQDTAPIAREPGRTMFACADCVGLGLACFIKFQRKFWMLPLHATDRQRLYVVTALDHGQWVVPGRYRAVGKQALLEREGGDESSAVMEPAAKKRKGVR